MVPQFSLVKFYPNKNQNLQSVGLQTNSLLKYTLSNGASQFPHHYLWLMQLWHQNNFTVTTTSTQPWRKRRIYKDRTCISKKMCSFKPEANKLAIKKISLAKLSHNPTFAVMGTAHKSLQITVNSTEPGGKNWKEVLNELDSCSSNVLLLTDSIRHCLSS